MTTLQKFQTCLQFTSDIFGTLTTWFYFKEYIYKKTRFDIAKNMLTDWLGCYMPSNKSTSFLVMFIF